MPPARPASAAPASVTAAPVKLAGPLARVLQFPAVEEPESPAAALRAGERLLAAEPECDLGHDAVCRVHGIANLHTVTQAGPAVFAASLPLRVREQPAVAGMLAADGATEARIYAALRAAGNPATDRGSRHPRPGGGLDSRAFENRTLLERVDPTAAREWFSRAFIRNRGTYSGITRAMRTVANDDGYRSHYHETARQVSPPGRVAAGQPRAAGPGGRALAAVRGRPGRNPAAPDAATVFLEERAGRPRWRP